MKNRTKLWRGFTNTTLWLLPGQADILKRAAAKSGQHKKEFLVKSILSSLNQEDQTQWVRIQIEHECARAGINPDAA